MTAGEFSCELRVYIEDTDAGGIVYYVNYLKFMERARTEFMRSLGFGKDYIFNRDLMFVVRDVAVQYRQLGGASMVFKQCVLRGDEVLATGAVTVACVDRSGVKPRRLPADMAAALQAASCVGASQQ